MKLETLLKQITPLPWLIVTATDGDKWIGTNQGDDRITTLDGNTQPIDHAYLVHAADVLPELVAAAKILQHNWGKNLREPMGRLNAALALAENINREAGNRRNHQANGTHNS